MVRVTETINQSPGLISPEQRLGEFRATLRSMEAINPQGFDTRYAVGTLALDAALEEPYAQSLILDQLEARAAIRPEPHLYLMEHYLRNFNMAAQDQRKDLSWPERANQRRVWDDHIHDTIDPVGDLIGDFDVRARSAEVQSNVWRRGIFAAMLAKIYGERYSSSPRLADVGASLNHVANALAMEENLFNDISVSKGAYEGEAELVALIQTISEERPNFEQLTGFDRVSMFDELHDGRVWDSTARKWVRVCTIRPDEEALNPDILIDYYIVDTFLSDKIDLLKIDFSKPLPSELTAPGHHYFDIVNISAMLYQYQAQPEVVRIIIDNCLKIASKNAVIGLLDFVETPVQNSGSLLFRKNRPAYSFRGLVYDTAHPELGFQEVAMFKSGRCDAVSPGRDWLQVLGSSAKLSAA